MLVVVSVVCGEGERPLRTVTIDGDTARLAPSKQKQQLFVQGMNT